MSFMTFLSKERNRRLIAWIGSGVIVVAGGVWQAVIHFWPNETPATQCAQYGGIAAGNNASGNTITITNSSGAAGDAAEKTGPCVDSQK